MRQGSSCLPWEPLRCSTYSRSHSGPDAELKNTIAALKQQCPTRPSARQWTSWAPSNTGAEPSEPVTTKSECPRLGNFDTRSTVRKSVTIPEVSEHVIANSSFPAESLKALPTRPKHATEHQHNKQVHASVEESSLRPVHKQQTETLKCGGLTVTRPTPAVEVNVARSRCHPRRRAAGPDDQAAVTPKLRRDTDCTEAIVRLIVFFSTKLVHTIWSQASTTPKTSKDFNGAGVLPLQVFIQETLRRSKTSYSTLQVALFYLILLRPHVKPCQATQQQYTPGCRALQCGRRMFLTALILASKYLQDRNYSARAWSKISGLPVAEINENERNYLELIKYNLHMSKETFENWSRVVLTICKTSGKGAFAGRPDSPPSSPDSLAYPMESGRPGSCAWWAYHLTRLNPETVKNPKTTEDFLAGLTTNAPSVDSSLSLDTPPSSPESLVDLVSDQSSSLVMSTEVPVQAPTNGQDVEVGQSPASSGSVPSRPIPANLPTPQTTPRNDTAFAFSRQSSQSDLRCRASQQALSGVDRQAFHAANLETCPPPKPRSCMGSSVATSHPLKECADSSAVAWMSSPESSFSDSSSNTTRSRSSSISSVSSVWSMPGTCARQVDNKPTSVLRVENQASGASAQLSARMNIGGYSFYHPVGNMHSTTENITPRANGLVRAASESSVQQYQPSQLSRSSDDLNDNQIAQLLASLSSQSDGQIQQRVDPAVVNNALAKTSMTAATGPVKNHKRNRSSKEENILQDEIREFLWNEEVEVCVEDDKRPTSYVETADKEAQYPLKQWAHPKKPVPNALHNKRIALQHLSSQEPKHATELAADFLRCSVTVT